MKMNLLYSKQQQKTSDRLHVNTNSSIFQHSFCCVRKYS
uniref:Uncharacterized protein n=1 Tax=Anguilla anguilla TaxID=7936 RepID=A0A0E9R788_ANGAN